MTVSLARRREEFKALTGDTGGYSVSASARTSYTRVEMMDDHSLPSPLQVSEVERAEEEAAEEIPHTPQVSLTFLHVSGRRRTMNFDPTYTVGRVKELLWNTWPSGLPSFLHTYFDIALTL